jgi:hypothetical protein
MTAAAQILLAMAVLGPEVPPFHGIAGEKSESPATDKTAAIPEATRRAVLRHYPRPGQRAQRTAVRGRKRSAQLVRRYAGADLKPGWVRG